MHRFITPALLSFAFVATFGSAAAGAVPADPIVTTIGGDGHAGSRTGPTTTARFVTPFGVVRSSDGSVYVSDFSLHVVRRITPIGTIDAVAGVVSPQGENLYGKGGLVNGAADQARFNGPAGLAVASDGSILVADSRNYCIRKIARGIVSTFSGICGTAGKLDGTASTATYEDPLSLAIDRAGTIYVADYSAGIRRIAADGSVTTLSNPIDNDATGICSNAAYSGSTIAIVGRNGVRFRDTTSATLVPRTYATDKPQDVQGIRTLGVPFQCTFIAKQDIVYTDIRTHTIRLFHLTDPNVTAIERAVAGGPFSDDAANDGGGFRDGAGEQALFNTPFGIASGPNGSSLVADGGNHRVRKLSGFDISAYDDRPSSPPSHALRIAYVGNSFAWWDSSGSDTTGSLLRRELETATHRSVQVDTYMLVGINPTSAKSALEEQFAPLGYDAVVYLVNSNWITSDPSTSRFVGAEAQWRPPFEAGLVSLQASARQNNVRVFLADCPFGFESSPTNGFFEIMSQMLDQDYVSRYQLMDAAVSRVFPERLSLKTAIDQSGDLGSDPPIYGTEDGHPTPFGRHLFARAIAKYLLAQGVGGP